MNLRRLKVLRGTGEVNGRCGSYIYYLLLSSLVVPSEAVPSINTTSPVLLRVKLEIVPLPKFDV